MKIRILYVEDDETLGFVTRDNLELKGYQIIHCKSGNEALDFIQNEPFDLCILDVMLPGVDGFTIAKIIRERDQNVPILFLTAKSLKEDKIHGLRIGGDDYIVKPFSIEELILKIEIFLKRSKVVNHPVVNDLKIGAYTFDYANQTLSHLNASRKLTQREADLLKYLIERKNVITKRSDILIKLWGRDDYFLGRSLDVFISRLRKYLKEDPALKIENIHGVGFRLEDQYFKAKRSG